MYENNNKNNSNSRKKFNNKKKNNNNNNSNNNFNNSINHNNNFNNHNKNNNNQQNKKFHNKKKNYKHYNKKTIEEYEKIYIEKRMKEEGDKPICPICNNPIYIIEEAIKHNTTGEYAHFECIVDEIKKDNINEIEKDERIVYLGAGTFGIIEEKQNGKHSKIVVKKRINYENRKIKKFNDDSDPEEDDLFNV